MNNPSTNDSSNHRTTHRRRFLLATAAVAGFSVAPSLMAGHHHRRCCCRCGCYDGCVKVCRLVCEEKKVTVTCWGSKEEDFCLPGPSCPDCEHCESVCGNCQSKAAEAKPKDEKAKDGKEEKAKDEKAKDEKVANEKVTARSKRFVWTSWIPSHCGDIHTRKKLMKKTITKTVPSYKWVVEELCPQCQSGCEPVVVEPDAKIPTPPKVEGAKVIQPVVSQAEPINPEFQYQPG